MTLREPVYDAKGRLLAARGAALDRAGAERLRERGVRHVYVEAAGLEDVQPYVPLSLKLQQQVLDWAEEAWQAVLAGPRPLPPEPAPSLAAAVVEELAAAPRGIALPEPDVAAPWYARRALHAAVGVAVLALGRLGARARDDLVLAALLHDAGLALHPVDDPRHVEAALALMEPPLAWPARARAAVAQHHERYDGSGFPRGLRGEAIDPGARILAVIDTYIDRIHPAEGEGMPPHEAVEYVLAAAGYDLDMEVAAAFADLVVPYPEGSLVRLGDGRPCVVVRAPQGVRARPVVREIRWREGRWEGLPERTMDLSEAEHRTLLIAGPVSRGGAGEGQPA
ncbi:MAG: HD domain-containing protein [Clostridia bacterium]|nr:HD domain-containing protein [Clostridia bacterium]MCL6521194.1 HD domain-containing protein [Bacillota bacterium]